MARKPTNVPGTKINIESIQDLDLPDTYREDIIALFEEGAGAAEIKAYIARHRGSFTHYLWDKLRNIDKEFDELIEFGLILSRAWWEKQGRKNLTNPTFQSTLWYMNIKNRFRQDWHEKAIDPETGKEEAGKDITLNINVVKTKKRKVK